MAYNRQTLTANRVAIGTTLVYMDEWTTPTANGVTPTSELGFANSVTMNLTAGQIELYNGTPQLLEEVFAGRETVDLTINVDEHYYKHWIQGYSTGLCDSTNETFSGGGLVQTNKVMIKAVHYYNDGGYREFYFWKCVGNGVIPITFEKGDGSAHNTYDLNFKAMYQTTGRGWDNVALNDGELLFKTKKFTAAGL